MLKLTYCLRKRPDLTHEQFYAYWEHTHGPLVCDRAELLGIVKYQQVHTQHDAARHAAYQARNGGQWEQFDGIAEVWVDPNAARLTEPADIARAARARQDLLEDERNFIDLSRSPMWLGEEKVFVDRRAT